MSRYKSEPVLELKEMPLEWWKSHHQSYPHLANMARKYLGVVATSVPSERLFSTADNIVNAKQSALDPENVESLFFCIIIFHSYLFHTKGLTTEHILHIYIVHIVIVYISQISLLKAVNW